MMISVNNKDTPMSHDLTDMIAHGEALARDGKESEAIAYFAALVQQYPQDPRAHFAYGGAFDFAGREAEAAPHYLRARELGLAGLDLQRWFVQMGSTLRNLGDHTQACAVLAEGCALYPNDAALRMFHALALVSAEHSPHAALLLLQTLLQHAHTADIDRFRRALTYYVDELQTQLSDRL
jgi:tetratricopeptide (TPR) repeat protein